MACCAQCDGGLQAHEHQAAALRWGVSFADAGPSADPFFRAASVGDLVAKAVPRGGNSWPRRDVHSGLMTYYLDYSDGGSGTTSPNSARLDELGEFACMHEKKMTMSFLGWTKGTTKKSLGT